MSINYKYLTLLISGMDPIECILGRRSIRKYVEGEAGRVKDEHLKLILECAIFAPSAGNLQPWKFYVVRNKKIKEELAAAAYNQRFIAQADVCVVVVAIPKISGRFYGARGEKLYCIQDTAAAVENILLASYALGYGSCWVGAFNENQVRKILNLSEGEMPVALVSIGVPRENSSAPARKKDVFIFIE